MQGRKRASTMTDSELRAERDRLLKILDTSHYRESHVERLEEVEGFIKLREKRPK